MRLRDLFLVVMTALSVATWETYACEPGRWKEVVESKGKGRLFSAVESTGTPLPLFEETDQSSQDATSLAPPPFPPGCFGAAAPSPQGGLFPAPRRALITGVGATDGQGRGGIGDDEVTWHRIFGEEIQPGLQWKAFQLVLGELGLKFDKPIEALRQVSERMVDPTTSALLAMAIIKNGGRCNAHAVLQAVCGSNVMIPETNAYEVSQDISPGRLSVLNLCFVHVGPEVFNSFTATVFCENLEETMFTGRGRGDKANGFLEFLMRSQAPVEYMALAAKAGATLPGDIELSGRGLEVTQQVVTLIDAPQIPTEDPISPGKVEEFKKSSKTRFSRKQVVGTGMRLVRKLIEQATEE